MGFLDKLFGRRGPSAASDGGIVRTVRCKRCGALITVRIDARNDLSLNGDGYFVRKTLVDDRCFSRIELEMTFDSGRRELSCDVSGGEVVSPPEAG
jgi:hypothetical protein